MPATASTCPLLFGEPNITPDDKTTRKHLLHVCISREFKCFSKNKTSPIVEWLKAVCRKAHKECKGPGVGAIGMCLTGNFAISLMVEESMIAPVACQPSLPLVPFTKGRSRALGMRKEDLEKAKAEAKKRQNPHVLPVHE